MKPTPSIPQGLKDQHDTNIVRSKAKGYETNTINPTRSERPTRYQHSPQQSEGLCMKPTPSIPQGMKDQHDTSIVRSKAKGYETNTINPTRSERPTRYQHSPQQSEGL